MNEPHEPYKVVKDYEDLGVRADTEVNDTGVRMFSSSDNPKMVALFYSSKCPLSNFYPAEFEVDGKKYTSTEQFFQHAKAVTFGDDLVAAEIMATDEPRDQKRIGQAVRGFDEELWNTVSIGVMRQACMAKFGQNPRLKRILLSTMDSHLAEASPTDLKWGTGIPMDHPESDMPSKWRGKNQLGEVLMYVRQKLSDEGGHNFVAVPLEAFIKAVAEVASDKAGDK